LYSHKIILNIKTMITMKKLIALFAFIGVLTFAGTGLIAQDGGEMKDSTAVSTDSTATDSTVVEENTMQTEEVEEPAQEEEANKGINNVLKEKFIEGDPYWMTPVLVVLIIGLALCIERIITLNLSTTNTKKLLSNLNDKLSNGDLEGAKDVCRSTRGPVASIFYQGLDRTDEGLEMVEKSIIAYGSVQMGMLEKGLVWISLFIALAPMLGFMGTVIGMIAAFDKIAEVGDINPTIVAGGIKVALLTTVFGLISAIILQIFYNYIISKIDSIVNNMEESSITFMDILVKNNVVKD
jgi:biopolymer transport protein ExbB